MNETVYSSDFFMVTAVPTRILKDEAVSLEAIGLYVKMWSLRNTGVEKFTIKDLLNKNDTLETIEKPLKLLHERGYIEKLKAGVYLVK